MTARPELALERILLALEADLIDASDAEIAEALDELGFKSIRGSLALADVRHADPRRWLAAGRYPPGEEFGDGSGRRVSDDRASKAER
jgi:hypothetical protein